MVRFSGSALLIGLSACAGSVPPVTFSTPAEISADYGALTSSGVPAPAYATTCYDRNLRVGTNYFNGLVTKQNQAGKLGMLGGAAVAAASAAGGPIGLVGGLGAATALGSGLLSSDATAPIGGELPVAGYSLWLRSHQAYTAAAPTPQDQPTAQLLCDANTALATPIGIQASQAAAMMSAPVVAIPSTGPVVVPTSPSPSPVVVAGPAGPPGPPGPPWLPAPPNPTPPPVVIVPPPGPPHPGLPPPVTPDPNGPVVIPTPELRGRGTLTPPGTPLAASHRRHQARAYQPTQEELQFRAIQQYGRNAVEGGQRVLPPMICVGSGCVR